MSTNLFRVSVYPENVGSSPGSGGEDMDMQAEEMETYTSRI